MAEESKTQTMKAVVPQDGVAVLVERPVPEPAAGQVLIKVHYAGVNRLDLLQTSGKYKLPAGVTDIVGLEISGTIAKVGAECTRDLAVGARVAALVIGGGYAEFCVAEEGEVLTLPDTVPLRTAAALPEAWGTAYQILHFVGNVVAGDTVLVHAAGSGVGTAATQLAIKAGARVIATAGSDAKLATAKRLGAVAGFNRKEGSWVEGVKEAAGEKGVTLILDCVGGSYYSSNANVIGMDGRWVLYGLLGGATMDSPLLSFLMRKRVRLQATTLRTRSNEYKARLMAAFQANAIPHFASGDFAPVIDSEYAIADVAAAHTHVSSNKSAGKVLLKFLDE